jgi:hypothetical protein
MIGTVCPTSIPRYAGRHSVESAPMREQHTVLFCFSIDARLTLPAALPEPTRPAPAPGLRQYVTLDQAAAFVNRSKRSLEKYLYEPAKVRRYAMPAPAVEGGGGRPSEWAWEEMRPWLERVFRRQLPQRLPEHFRAG